MLRSSFESGMRFENHIPPVDAGVPVNNARRCAGQLPHADQATAEPVSNFPDAGVSAIDGIFIQWCPRVWLNEEAPLERDKHTRTFTHRSA
jgi:hypothetical protein